MFPVRCSHLLLTLTLTELHLQNIQTASNRTKCRARCLQESPAAITSLTSQSSGSVNIYLSSPESGRPLPLLMMNPYVLLFGRLTSNRKLPSEHTWRTRPTERAEHGEPTSSRPRHRCRDLRWTDRAWIRKLSGDDEIKVRL